MSSDHALGAVAADEEQFIDRAASWNSAIVDVEVVVDRPRARYRLLAFGSPRASLSAVGVDGRIDVLTLQRPPPVGHAQSVLSIWSEDLDALLALVDERAPLAFIAEPVAIVVPPVPGWDAPAIPA
jgi:hypothetical protein